MNLNENRDCISTCDKILEELDRENVKVMYRKARACLNLKDYDSAISILESASTLEPENKSIISLTKKAKILKNQSEKKEKKIFKG